MIGVVVMYRLIPFKNLSDIDDCYNSMRGLYKDCLSSNTVLIQDTEDMVVEKYSVQQLYELSKNYGVSYEGFKITDDKIKINDLKLDIANVNFLNDTLSVSWDTPVKFRDFFNGLQDDYSEYKLKVSNSSNKVFEFTISRYYFNNMENGIVILFANNSPIILVDGTHLDCYLELVQVCKTKKGFELVITFTDLEIFLGIKLSNDLELLGFQNLEYFEGMSLVGDVGDFESMKLDLAKRKLTGDWSGII